MEQPILINRHSMHVSNQEMQTMAARGFACKAMEEARSQVVRDMEAMRKNAKKISDHKDMNTLFSKLLEVAKRGAKNINKHMAIDKTQIMVQEAAQQMDTLLHQEIGRRFVDGSESVTSSSAQSVARIITAAVNTEADIVIEMGKTLSEFISVMLNGMVDASLATWELFKLWWNLQDHFDEAMNRGLTMYDTIIQNSQWTTPEITREYREELVKVIMGVAAKSPAVKNEAARYLMQMGRISAYVAVAAAVITLLIGGYNYFVGKDSQPESNLQRWQRYM